MMPSHLFVAGAAAAFLAGLLAGWTVRDWRADADNFHALADALDRADQARDKGLAEGKAYAEFVANSLAQVGADQTKLREIYREVKVPVECAVAPAAVSVLEDSRRRANSAAAGQLGTALPGPAPTASPSDRP